MGRRLDEVVLLCLFLVVNYVPSNQLEVKIRRCSGTVETAKSWRSQDKIVIPSGLTNENQSLEFLYTNGSVECRNSKVKIIQLETTQKARPFRREKSFFDFIHNETQPSFTAQGYFYDGSFYFPPEDYCVDSFSQNQISIRVCTPNCNRNSNRRELPTEICIPKCCPFGEVLVYWNYTCRKLTEGEPFWKPSLYLDPETKWNYEETSLKVHFQRPNMPCKRMMAVITKFSYSTVIRAVENRGPPDIEKPARVLPNEEIVYFDKSRKWTQLDGSYCYDGFVNWGLGGDGIYTGSEDHQAVFHCMEEPPPNNFNFDRAMTVTVMLFVSSFFLLIGVIIYVILLEKQSIHGLTKLSILFSKFLTCVVLGVAHLQSIYPDLRGDSNERWSLCMVIAIVAHYFYLSEFTWLTILNWRLWRTLSQNRRPQQQPKVCSSAFLLHSTIGWGLPLVLIAIFVTLEELYNNPNRSPLSKIMAPDYFNIYGCFVPYWARGYYVYTPAMIFLLMNAILIVVTIQAFCRFSMKVPSESGRGADSRVNADRNSGLMFFKLFIVMGATSFVELLLWYYNDDIDSMPTFAFAITCACLTSGILVFGIFCVNQRIYGELTKKYPTAVGVISRTTSSIRVTLSRRESAY